MSSLTRTSVRWASALLFVSMLVACGSSGSKSAATTAAKSTTTTSAGSTTTNAGGTSPATTPSSIKATGGGSFCTKIADSLNSAATRSAEAATTPAALRKLLEASERKNQEALSSAPDEIKGDLQTINAASAKFLAALKRAGYDVTKVSPTASAGFSAPAVTAASGRVLAFVTKRCGINLGGAGTGAVPPTTIP